MSNVRELIGISPRVETGAVKFGSDWPGLFIRGDDCINLMLAIETLPKPSDPQAEFLWKYLRCLAKRIKNDVIQDRTG